MVQSSIPKVKSTKVPTVQVIREAYDTSSANEQFEQELDKALEAKIDYIIIEPPRLGDETVRWISNGNFLYKSAIAAGVASITCGFILRTKPNISAPWCGVSLFCTGLYTASWSFDACSQYQVVDNDDEILKSLPISADVVSPVVIGYKPNTKVQCLTCGVSLLATAFVSWQFYQIWGTICTVQ